MAIFKGHIGICISFDRCDNLSKPYVLKTVVSALYMGMCTATDTNWHLLRSVINNHYYITQS